MSKHLDDSPKPPDPLWRRQHEWLHLQCTCGHHASLPIGATARLHGLDAYARLYELTERLRCSRCRAKPRDIEVKQRP